MYKTKNKLFFFLVTMTLVVLFIGLMGSVSAVDQTISPTTSGGLKKAIDNAGNGDTIYLENGVYSGKANTGLRISSSITIQGKGNNVVIDAKKADRIFSVGNGANFILNNIKLQNGRPNYGSDSTFGDRGGAVYVNSGKVSCSNVVFYNNSAFNDGGAICIQGEGSSFKNCKFISNTAKQGGAVYIIWYPASFTNCIFEKNGASAEGGAVALMMESNVYFSHCDFNYNFAREKGGAIVAYGYGNLVNCKFNKNEEILKNVYNAIHDEWGLVAKSPRISKTNCAITPNDGTKLPSTINTQSTSSKTDLKIIKITKKGNYRHVTIKNVGKKVTGSKFYLGIYDGTKQIKRILVNNLGAGKSTIVKVQIAKKYENKLKTFKVDSTNRIKESNKKNNSLKAR